MVPPFPTILDPVSEDPLDSDDLLDQINSFKDTHGVPTDDLRLAAASLPHTIRHQYLIDEVTNDFITSLSKFPDDKWGLALKPVEHRCVTGKKVYPKILVDVGGPKTPSKILLLNKALIDWMAVCKKKAHGAKCPWYQPSTQNQRLRTLFGSCIKRFDWQIEIGDFDFKGGLKGFIGNLYTKRYKEFSDVSTF